MILHFVITAELDEITLKDEDSKYVLINCVYWRIKLKRLKIIARSINNKVKRSQRSGKRECAIEREREVGFLNLVIQWKYSFWKYCAVLNWTDFHRRPTNPSIYEVHRTRVRIHTSAPIQSEPIPLCFPSMPILIFFSLYKVRCCVIF